jgi:hypothetical protein
LLQDGDVGVGVFREGEEIFVGSECPYVGSVGIRSFRRWVLALEFPRNVIPNRANGPVRACPERR